MKHLTGPCAAALRRLVPLALLLGCAPPNWPGLPVAESVPVVNEAEVETVLFLVGDTGDAREGASPLLARLHEDLERWSQAVDRDSAVLLVVLGDIVYPEGVRPRDTAEYHRDTSRVMGQVRLVAGTAARKRGTRAVFVAGNHDWGRREHREDHVRVAALAESLRLGSELTGADARLVPVPGAGGPEVIDLGDHLRVLLLDTAWWLVASTGEQRAATLVGLNEGFATADGRHVIIASHHPFRSTGPHGGRFPFWQMLGLRYLLFRSGATLQDITSVPYRELEMGLRSIFARHGAPLAMVGGHEHSLQVIEAVEPTDPRVSLVSGAGSKLTPVGRERSVRFALSAPGYMRVVVERGGGILLFVEAMDPAFLACAEEEPERSRCLLDGQATWRTVYATRLH
jgi:hypothetical protein